LWLEKDPGSVKRHEGHQWVGGKIAGPDRELGFP